MVLNSATETIMLFAFHTKVFSLIICSPLFKNESVVAIRGRAPLNIHLAIKGLLKRILVVLVHLVRTQTLLKVTFTDLSSTVCIRTYKWAFGLINVRLQRVIEAFLMKHVSTSSQCYDLISFK